MGKGGERRRPIAASGARRRGAPPRRKGRRKDPRRSAFSAFLFFFRRRRRRFRRILRGRFRFELGAARLEREELRDRRLRLRLRLRRLRRGAVAAAAAALRQGLGARRGLLRARAFRSRVRSACAAIADSSDARSRNEADGSVVCISSSFAWSSASDAPSTRSSAPWTCLPSFFFLADGVLPFFSLAGANVVIMCLGPIIFPSTSVANAIGSRPSRSFVSAVASVSAARNSSNNTAPALGLSFALTPSASENSTRSVTLCPSAKNRAACAAFTLRSCALMWGRRRRTLILSCLRRSTAFFLASRSFCRSSYRSSSKFMTRHTGGTARGFTSTRSSPASFARRRATIVERTSCAGAEEGAEGPSLTRRTWRASIASLTRS